MVFASLLLYSFYATTRVLIGQSVDFLALVEQLTYVPTIVCANLYRLFLGGARGGGRTLSRRAGRTSLIDGVV